MEDRTFYGDATSIRCIDIAFFYNSLIYKNVIASNYVNKNASTVVILNSLNNSGLKRVLNIIDSNKSYILVNLIKFLSCELLNTFQFLR